MWQSLASDNYAGVLPEMIAAIIEANQNQERSYGYDDFTAKAKQEFENIFGNEIEVTFVFNGTGANVLGISTVTQSFHAILCASSSHLYQDESTAPESFTGCRLIPLPINAEGKLTIETIEKAIVRRGDEHHPQIKLLSLTQTTEYGTVYTLEELKQIGELLKKHQIIFHLDGARLYNAAVSLNCSLQDMTTAIGVDILSLGGTKIGMLFGEAVVFFDKKLAENLKYKQKQSMQLPSKMRFIAAQFHQLLKYELWKPAAIHAQNMAHYLYVNISNFNQIQITKPVQANAVFAILPASWIEPLQVVLPFYVWNENTHEVRWMCSFDTQKEAIDRFVLAVKNLANS